MATTIPAVTSVWDGVKWVDTSVPVTAYQFTTAQINSLLAQTLKSGSVVDFTDHPRANPVIGDMYIVSIGTGAFAGTQNNGHIALLTATGWEFFTPTIGDVHLVGASGKTLTWNGTTWVESIPSAPKLVAKKIFKLRIWEDHAETVAMVGKINLRDYMPDGSIARISLIGEMASYHGGHVNMKVALWESADAKPSYKEEDKISKYGPGIAAGISSSLLMAVDYSGPIIESQFDYECKYTYAGPSDQASITDGAVAYHLLLENLGDESKVTTIT